MVSAFLLSDVQADSSLQKVSDKGELVVGFCAQYPPFESKNEKTGQFEGFDVDLSLYNVSTAGTSYLPRPSGRVICRGTGGKICESLSCGSCIGW